MSVTGLKGKVALVTGANHGIGAATAKALAAEGTAVFVTYLRIPLDASLARKVAAGEVNTPGEELYRMNQAVSAEEVVRAIRERGGQAEAWEADLSDPHVLPALFDRAEQTFGPVDVLVNNAAHCVADTFIPTGWGAEDPESGKWHRPVPITPESHDQHFAVNSRAVALMMVEYARRHVERKAQWGRIINISTDGASGFSGEVSYGASKHALESYSRAAASELKPFGITVNVVAPGPIQTGYIAPALEAKLTEYVGQPEDVADVIVFLASDQARWLTGQLLYVGGGHVMPL
jgi:3-oxoacyl-[acyl-carrier protein] reductase